MDGCAFREDTPPHPPPPPRPQPHSERRHICCVTLHLCCGSESISAQRELFLILGGRAARVALGTGQRMEEAEVVETGGGSGVRSGAAEIQPQDILLLVNYYIE